MKKALSLVLALSLLLALALPAAAEEGAEARLSAVTLAVKETLDLDTDAYSDFSGYPEENALAPLWYLDWYGDGGSLSVTAGEDSRILSYFRHDAAEYWDRGFQNPSFPEGGRDGAQKAAQAFLDKVLAANETVVFREDEGESLNQSSYYFRGTICLNGVPSPLGMRIEVRAADNCVMNFRRDDLASSYIGTVPSGQADVSAQRAGELLKELLTMRLEYSLNEDGRTASLRYLPNSRDDCYVDAHTGELVNLTEKRRALADGDKFYGYAEEMSANTAADAGGGAFLTEVEQSGVEKLSGVLSAKALDQKVRAVSELGLETYTLAESRFYLETAIADGGTDTGDVFAQLTYGKQDGEGGIWQKCVTVDARTGELESLWSGGPWNETLPRTVDRTAAREKAEAFLTRYWGEDFARCADYDNSALYGGDVPAEDVTTTEWYFIYARQENGYFFPDDQFSVSISALDGSVSGFQRREIPGVTFESAEGLVSASDALDAWFGTFTVDLRYLAVPVELDLSRPEYQPLAALGGSWFSALELGWSLTPDYDVQGVDAKTGQVIRSEPWSWSGLTYDDLEGSWARTQIETLARYQVGFDGGSFAPGKTLVQKDMVALLLSMQGYRYDPEDLEGAQADDLYRSAYRMGILTPEARSDDKILTRGETVKLLLDSAGYGPIARFQGIYRCSYADEASIPAAYYGYAALAQGLGVIQGDGGAFAAGRTATRAEAAAMIYNLLSYR